MSIYNLPQPELLDQDPNKIKLDTIANWETEYGGTMPQPGPEYDLVHIFAQQESIFAGAVNQACSQNYLPFATETNLDNIGNNFGVERLASTNAKVNITISPDGTLVNDVEVFAGHRIQTQDGLYIFTVDEDTIIPAGTVISDPISCTAQTSGTGPNDYGTNTINNNLDNSTGILPLDNGTWSNTSDTSSGGGDPETDEAYRERLVVFNETKSTAGSRRAYEFYARSYSTNIVDAYAVNLIQGSGIATVYILEKDGTIPSAATLQAVEDYLSADEIRPICDQVSVEAPTSVSFGLDGEIDYFPAYAGVIDTIVSDAISQAKIWVREIENKLGKDIIKNEIIQRIMDIEGVSDVRLNNPLTNITLGPSEFGLHDGTFNLVKGNPVE